MFDGKGRGQVAQNVVCPQTKMQRHLGLRVFCKQVDLSHYAVDSRLELAEKKIRFPKVSIPDDNASFDIPMFAYRLFYFRISPKGYF